MGSADPTPPFPFIIARGRSGTTLLRAMFDAHPSMAIPNESHFVVQFANRRRRYETAGGFDLERYTGDLFAHWAFRRWDLPKQDVLVAYEEVPPLDLPGAMRTLYSAYSRSKGKSRYGDKTPSYVRSVELLATTFPEAVFIHLIRDGRDVALSYLDTDFGSRTLAQAAIYWDRFVRAGRAAGVRLGPTRYREIRYEDLVREPETVLRGLCPFVGLSFDQSMLAYHERAGDLVSGLSHKEHHRNLFKPPTVAIRDWRRDLPLKDVEVFEALAGELLEELGYETMTRRHERSVGLAAARLRIDTEARRAAHGARVRGRKLRRRARRLIRSRTVQNGSRTQSS